MTAHETDLAAFYDQEAPARAGRDLDPERVRRRELFSRLLRAEGRVRLLEIGTGPGLDASVFLRDGLSVTGVDLSAEHVRLAREAGVDAHVASVLRLPFADGSMDAGWTMSTLLHVTDADLDAALVEVARVLRPGAPLAVGLWRGEDTESHRVTDTIEPRRFFSLRSDERLQATLGRHGAVEQFDTWPGIADGSCYQWCVLRLPGG